LSSSFSEQWTRLKRENNLFRDKDVEFIPIDAYCRLTKTRESLLKVNWITKTSPKEASS
jgi:hypothetical protein